jgi:hypothetical protein
MVLILLCNSCVVCFYSKVDSAAAGATHYARWANLARAVGLRLNRRAKALVAGSYLLLPNLLVPFLDVRCLHVVLVRLLLGMCVSAAVKPLVHVAGACLAASRTCAWARYAVRHHRRILPCRCAL